MTTPDKLLVGITHGDINGISYEVILKTLIDTRLLDFCTPILYGSPKIAAYHRKALRMNTFSLNHITEAENANLKRVNVLNCIDDNTRVELGKSTEMAGGASFQALERATADLREGKIDMLVTAPINKHNIQQQGFQFPGHTEYLANMFSPSKTALMLMVSDWLRVGVVAGHVPMQEMPTHITYDNILGKLQIMDQALRSDFGINRPVIAVFGLNPHAGDQGLLGKEEQEIIIPAIEEAKQQGIMALGPYAADGFFGSQNIKSFDGILAMYHDQGLAPFKALAFDQGVNYTAGLDIVRTSPAHGTAYELAGKGEANPNAFRQALYLAIKAYRNRTEYNEIKDNALELGSENADEQLPS